MTLSKELYKQVKTDFDLHVLLIMRQEGKKKPEATVQAYYEGTAGLLDRIAPAAPKGDK